MSFRGLLSRRVRNPHLSDLEVKMDPIQSSMGSIGKWQIFVCGMIFLLKFPVGWHQLSVIFLAPKVSFTCSNQTLDQCDSACPNYTYDKSIFTNTIKTEWDLVCSNSYLADLQQTIFMLGILFGNMIFGTLADKCGRRNPLVWAVFLQLAAGIASSFAPWFWLFCVFRFLTALATGGTMITSFVIVMEIIGIKWRELVSILYQIPFNLGHLTLPLFSYFLRDWRYFQFAISIPSVVLISYYWLVPESPRWLFTVGRTDEAVAILTKAARTNDLPTDTIKDDIEAYAASKITSNDKSSGSKGNFLDLFKTPNLRGKTIFMCYNWFTCGLCFFGVTQYVSHLGGDIFVNVAISASLTIPGTILVIFLTKYWGRKRTLILANLIAGCSMLVIAFIPATSAAVLVTFASIGVIGMSMAFPTVYLYAGELFPTVIRNIGMGTCSMIARIGSMIAPQVTSLDQISHYLPPIIFGVVPLIGAITVIFLPETLGITLPETIEDAENFGKKSNKDKNDVNNA